MKKIFLFLTIVLSLISCKPADNAPSILEGQVCGASCWNQIIIGKTTRQELKDIISKIPNVDQSSVTRLEEPGSDVVFQIFRDVQNKKIPVIVGVRTNRDNGQVSMIIFDGDLGLTAQKIMDIFGEPDFASPQYAGDNSGVCVSLVNSQQGVTFGECAYSEKYSITPDAEVEYLVLFDPSMFQTLVDENFLRTDYPWTGYGKIEDHYWSP